MHTYQGNNIQRGNLNHRIPNFQFWYIIARAIITSNFDKSLVRVSDLCMVSFGQFRQM